MNWCKNSLTSAGKKEAGRSVRQKSTGLPLKRPCARTCWIQELRSDQTKGCIADRKVRNNCSQIMRSERPVLGETDNEYI